MIPEDKLAEYRYELLSKLENQKESYIRQALSELLDRGLLVFEYTLPGFDLIDGKEVKINSSFRLVLKNMEYVRKLEKQNRIMREALEEITTLIGCYQYDAGTIAEEALKEAGEVK